MGGSDDTGTLLDLWGYPDPSGLFMAHPLDVGFSSASYSGFSVEPFALHYSVPLGDDGVGHHLENVCVLVL